MSGALPEPKRPSDLLGHVLRQARSVATRSDTQRALDRALGEPLAEHCRVAGLRAGRLIVEVDSAPLYAELQGFRRDEVREAMNQQLSGAKVTEITFRPSRADHGGTS